MGIHKIYFDGGLLTSARHTGKLVEYGKACEEAQTKEEDKSMMIRKQKQLFATQ